MTKKPKVKEDTAPLTIPDPPKVWLLYLGYEDRRTGGKSESNKPYSFRSTEYVTVTFGSLTRYHTYGSEDLAVTEEQFNADSLFVVVVRHTDGDSFGSSSGNWAIAGVSLTEEGARAIEVEARTPATKTGYRPWDGWACHLENVEIHCFKIHGEEGAKEDTKTNITYHD